MAAEEDEEIGDSKQIASSVRSAKKAARPTKITEAEPAKLSSKGGKKGKGAGGAKKPKIKIGTSHSSFSET
jgi:hypothetical protein